MTATALRVSHKLYGKGWWQRLADRGQAFIRFDADPCVRCVLIRDLAPVTLRESAADNDRQISAMLGHDVRAVERCLRAEGGL